ncbi:MAG: efflux RND transporter periplasmic adaptor subunit [Gammaproteobacteria bacterium]
MMRKLLIPALILLGSLLGAMTLMATSPELAPARPEAAAATVRVVTATPQSVRMTVHSQGTVEPNTESELVSEVAGRIVWKSEALVNGGSFAQGDELLRLDDQDYRATLERARAALARANAEFEHSQFEFQRLESLESRQLASRSALENAQRVFRIAEAARQDAEAGLKQAEHDLARTRLYAPFAGLVRRQGVDIGQFVNRGAAVATLYASAESEVRLPIADRQLAFLNVPVGLLGELPPDQQPAVTLTADYAGRALTWTGRIVRTEAAIDTASRMVHVVARVGNSGQPVPLGVGLFVNAEIEGLVADNIVRLPRSALRSDNQVLVVDEDNQLRFRRIEPLRLYQDEVFVSAGLAAGERICVTPLQTVIDGMRVVPVPEDGDAVPEPAPALAPAPHAAAAGA